MENIYFKDHNGELYTKFTKEEIYSMIDPYDWNTMLYWLEEMDYPPLSCEYFRKLQIAEERNKDGDFLIEAWDKSTIKWGI